MKTTSLPLPLLFAKFPSDADAEKWLEEQRWPDGFRICPDCGSTNTAVVKSRKPMPYRCRDCRRHFSVRKGTVMQHSKLGHRTWVLAIYLLTAHPKGYSSRQLARTLGIDHKTAWHLAHRIREGFDLGKSKPLAGPIEVDEAFMGGRERSKHANKKLRARHGTVGKTPVVGIIDRATNTLVAKPVPSTKRAVIHPFIFKHVAPDAKIYSDESPIYRTLPNHQAVKHKRGQYVDGPVHTQSIESAWAIIKRMHKGTYHSMSPKHLHRYVRELAGRHNLRPLEPLERMAAVARALVGKRLTWRKLVAGPPAWTPLAP